MTRESNDSAAVQPRVQGAGDSGVRFARRVGGQGGDVAWHQCECHPQERIALHLVEVTLAATKATLALTVQGNLRTTTMRGFGDKETGRMLA
jgi:hypothetical protein